VSFAVCPLDVRNREAGVSSAADPRTIQADLQAKRRFRKVRVSIARILRLLPHPDDVPDPDANFLQQPKAGVCRPANNPSSQIAADAAPVHRREAGTLIPATNRQTDTHFNSYDSLLQTHTHYLPRSSDPGPETVRGIFIGKLAYSADGQINLGLLSVPGLGVRSCTQSYPIPCSPHTIPSSLNPIRSYRVSRSRRLFAVRSRGANLPRIRPFRNFVCLGPDQSIQARFSVLR
jgi:hypothetical protein